MDKLFLAASLPALAVLTRLAPTSPLVSSGRTLVGLAPFDDVFFERRSSGQIDNRVHRAGVVDLIVRNRGGIDGTRTGMAIDLVLNGVRRHSRSQDLRKSAILIAHCPGEILPFRMGRIFGRTDRIEGNVAGTA